MTHNPVAANLIMAVCILGGFFLLGNIQQEVFPSFILDKVTISVSYPGASPEEVEKGIVKPIEESIVGLEGIKEITGQASEGSGQVTVELIEGEDLQKLADDIRTEVDRIRTFPEDAEEPKINIVSRKRGVIDLVIYGDVSKKVLHHYAETIRDQLISDKNITQVDIAGLPPLEISIQVPQAKLRHYKLTLAELANRISRLSVELPFGGIKTSSGEILLRMTERKDYGGEFAKLPIIMNQDGSKVLLEDIAIIDDSFEDSDYLATYNGKPAVMLQVYRVGKQTPTDVSNAVRNNIKEILQKMPSKMGIGILRDRSTIFRQRIELLLRNASIGLFLVLLVLGIFLELKLAFWVMMGIPISFLGSLLILPTTGVSINMISMFAYIIALGIVVDDAIIVGENIYQYHEQGYPFLKAAIHGTRSVAVPVVFSILTNIATFMPLYFVPGFMGKIFRQIPTVVVTVFFISLLESIYILPAHLGHQKDRTGKGSLIYRFQKKFSAGYKWLIRNVYGSILKMALKTRYIMLSIALGVLIVSLAWARSGRMGFQMFPRVESDYSDVTVVMPYGTPIEKSKQLAIHIVKSAQLAEKQLDKKCIVGIFAEIGKGGSHNVRVKTYLVDAKKREKLGMSTMTFTKQWRKVSGQILGTEFIRFAADSGGPGSGASLNIELTHSDVDVLRKASKELAKGISEIQYTEDVDDGYQPGKQQLDFTILPKGRALNMTPSGIGREIRNAYYGAEVVRQLRGRNEVKIIVRLPKSERISEYNLDEMIIRTPSGKEVMLRDVTTWKRGRAYTTIKRRNGRRIVQVTSNVEPRSKSQEVLNKALENVLPHIKKKYAGLSYSFEGREAERRESLGSLRYSFIVAMFVVYALLAIPFGSYTQPLIVMVAIPFGIVGAVIGHLIMGYSLSLVSMFGIVALSGVVINDSLVLIDRVNTIRKEDKSIIPFDAIVLAATQRFRPIMLTTLTTFLD